MGISYGVYGIGPNEYTSWEPHFCWLPRKCQLSGRRLWLTRAVRGLRVVTGSDEPVFVYFWHHEHEHLKWKLKGN